MPREKLRERRTGKFSPTNPQTPAAARLILEAKRLLTRREMYIKNIAYDLGFSEPQNFTRFFRTHTGTSPETFRRMLDK